MKFSKILPIQSFLEQDFYETGYRDGFDHHTEFVMNNRIKSIEATFIFRLGMAIGQKLKRLSELINRCKKPGEFPEGVMLEIESVTKDYEALIAWLETGKELLPDKKGWLNKPIGDYRAGFIRGADDYIAGKR